MQVTTPGRTVDERVRALAAARRASQETLGQVLGISQQAVSRRLSGQVDFRLAELQTLATYFDVPVEHLLNPAKSADA